jgi:cell shape-determining protein MreC
MRPGNKYSLVLLIFATAILVMVLFVPSLGWKVRAWLNPRTDTQTAAALSAQNEVLQAKLAVLQNVADQLPKESSSQIRAMVLSQYPFGFKNEMLLNAGAKSGVSVGKAVTFQGVYIGSILGVFPDSSVVRTIFDPAFKMPIRIGSHGIDALLVGGSYPKATSIAKGVNVVSGDIIYAAAPGLPYGLPIGKVDATTVSADNLFQEASLSVVYDVNELQTVFIAQ